MTDDDGRFLGELTMDAVAYLGEHYSDQAQVVAAKLRIVVRDHDGTHVATIAATHDHHV